MDITVGTFNLNNLFSRFDLYTETEPPRWLAPTAGRPEHDGQIAVSGRGTVEGDGRIVWRRTFRGKLILGKSPEAQQTLADRIEQLDVDVLAVQEVENLPALEDFVRFFRLTRAGYRHLALVEGNDRRLIDVGLVSRLPIGAVTSWRHRTHPQAPTKPVFSRDLLQVEILGGRDRRPVLTLYVNHLKSQLAEDENDVRNNDTRRLQQAESVMTIIREEPPRSPYVVLGDMNAGPEDGSLAPLAHGLAPALAGARETGGPYPANDPTPPPVGVPWTHRYRGDGTTRYELYDQIWLDPRIADRLDDAWILRRTSRGGDASDHDPAAIRLSGLRA